jgi:3-oxoacyl-[acyl-carrier protein] reductase/7-alpha-hydroxysteroid dehydrogenase
MRYVNHIEAVIAKAIRKNSRLNPPTPYRTTRRELDGVLGVGCKMGEGWLLTAEMCELIDSGVPNIVCVQPFGCLPNHIAGKGTIRALREKYPNARVGGISPDLASLADVRSILKTVSATYGCIDILVNNAGVSESTPFMSYTEETFDKVMDLNVKGVFNATRAAAECMVPRGSGVILSTSSMVSISGQPSGFAYPASKYAVNGLTVSLARELGPKGIRVNAVAPGITETDMMKSVPKEVIEPLIRQIPLRRLGQPEDIANAFTFLASEEASYITGVVLSVDGMARS